MTNINKSSIEKACKRIAPAWPLENFVAVNPYLGLSDMFFEKAAKLMLHRGAIKLYMPLPFYLEKLNKGEISNAHLLQALADKHSSLSVEEFINQSIKLKNLELNSKSCLLFTQLKTKHSSINWTEKLVDYISAWCSAYFDKFQNGKAAGQPDNSLFHKWRKEAEIDLQPEILGITNFRKSCANIPNDEAAAVDFLVAKLGIDAANQEAYFHALLLQVVGWSSYCSGLDWHNNLYNGKSNISSSFLTVLLAWEYALMESSEASLKSLWLEQSANLQTNEENQAVLEAQCVFQQAFDIAFQEQLKMLFLQNAEQSITAKKTRKTAQMIFCIDVRSEVFRRNIEKIDPHIETLGFAGFFGFPIKYSPIAHEEGKNQCPVLLPAGHEVKESRSNEKEVGQVQQKRFSMGSFQNAWSSFKSGAGSSFSFVSPLGLYFLPKLIGDSFGWTTPVESPKKNELKGLLSAQGKLDISNIPLTERINMGLGALTAMGLTTGFAPLVLITGHGSSSINNPHATGLDCGACGGSSGEVNALTAAQILNDVEVRIILKLKGIDIPKDTFFLACLHDTTTDEITILNRKDTPTTHHQQLVELEDKLKKASAGTRQARSARFELNSHNRDAQIIGRSKDWAQTRPEWGLAGCSSFIIAPRKRTQFVDLQSKAFLHSYEWKNDKEFKVLEAIMTAPMVVTSWINLQYYASTVDNNKLGAGNKTLHNVVGGIGVIEGARGDLRIGLPMQSIHDGQNYQHQPQRLNVVIEAPIEAITEVLQNHPTVRELCDNGWIFLMNLNEEGKIAAQYIGNLKWKKITYQQSKKKRKLTNPIY